MAAAAGTVAAGIVVAGTAAAGTVAVVGIAAVEGIAIAAGTAVVADTGCCCYCCFDICSGGKKFWGAPAWGRGAGCSQQNQQRTAKYQ